MVRVFLRQRGLTLIEIVIVLAIVGVLITIALPGYRQQVLTTNRVIATAELRKLVAMQEQFRQSYRRYATDLAELGLGAAHYGLDRQGNRITVSDRSGVYLVGLNVDGGQTTVPITAGNLALGTWQGIYLCEHRDQPQHRKLLLTLTD